MSSMTRENKYQVHIMNRLRRQFPGCFILKNDSGYMQGVPDMTVLFVKPFWAMLEVKASIHSRIGPNQEFYVEMLNNMCFAAIIYPENEEEVFSALQHALES